MDKPLLVVMGVSGAGKSTVGELLARRLELPFADGDDFHSAENKRKLSHGSALEDRDRAPWLEQIGRWLAEHEHSGGVIACSALKRSYRMRLRAAAPRMQFVYLRGDPELLEQRVTRRAHHFMPASLLASQLATLEPLAADEPGITLELAERTAAQLVGDVVVRLS